MTRRVLLALVFAALAWVFVINVPERRNAMAPMGNVQQMERLR